MESADSFDVDSLRARVDFLRQTQNVDGGWGYFPGRQSWLEPTAWAALALHSQGDTSSTKAWRLIKTWQQADGSCRPCAAVALPNWTAALAITLGTIYRDETAVQRGADYLLNLLGEDSKMSFRIAKFLSPASVDREPTFQGWPWKPGCTSWIEPTAHSITALRLAAKMVRDTRIETRAQSAQSMILHLRCKDGGWNYGANVALGTPLESFPETTALALVGLVGRNDVGDAVRYMEGLRAATQAPLATAWLTIALRLHGKHVRSDEKTMVGQDTLLTALEVLGSPEGNWRLLA